MKKILLLGKDGQVGWELQRSLAPLGELVAYGRQQANFEDLDALRSLVRELAPDIIVNAAAYTAVDKAESEPERARRINVEAVGILAEEASRLNAWLVHYSTDYVFDGSKATPYTEDDRTHPLSVYGRTKLEGEQSIQACHRGHLIFRTSWVYGVRGSNFAKTMLRLAQEREELKVVADQFGAPTSAALIADVTALALHRVMNMPGDADALAGVYHLVAGGRTSWHQYAQYVMELALARGMELKVQAHAVQPIAATAYPTPAERPYNSCLATDKLQRAFQVHLPDWRQHVQGFMDEITHWKNHAT
jgi:dTDP-4-dehydrorhamnose reductase